MSRKTDISLTAKMAEDAIRTMREVSKADYWSPTMIAAYNRADCVSQTVKATSGISYRISLSAVGTVYDVCQINQDGSERFYRV